MAEPPFNNKSSNRGKKRSIDEINGTVEHREATRARDHDYFCSNQILQREQHHNFQHQLRSSTMANHTNPMVRGLRESYIAALEVANAATRARGIIQTNNRSGINTSNNTIAISSRNTMDTINSNNSNNITIASTSRSTFTRVTKNTSASTAITRGSSTTFASPFAHGQAITSGSNIAHGSNTTANNTFTRYRISSGTHIIGSQVVASTNNAITGGSLSGSSNISNGITSYAAQQVPDTIKDDTFYESDDDDQTSVSSDDELAGASQEVHPNTSFTCPRTPFTPQLPVQRGLRYPQVATRRLQDAFASHPTQASTNRDRPSNSSFAPARRDIQGPPIQPRPLPCADCPIPSVEPDDFQNEDRHAYIRNLYRHNRFYRRFRIVLSFDEFSVEPEGSIADTESVGARSPQPDHYIINPTDADTGNTAGQGSSEASSSNSPLSTASYKGSEYLVDDVNLNNHISGSVSGDIDSLANFQDASVGPDPATLEAENDTAIFEWMGATTSFLPRPPQPFNENIQARVPLADITHLFVPSAGTNEHNSTRNQTPSNNTVLPPAISTLMVSRTRSRRLIRRDPCRVRPRGGYVSMRPEAYSATTETPQRSSNQFSRRLLQLPISAALVAARNRRRPAWEGGWAGYTDSTTRNHPYNASRGGSFGRNNLNNNGA